MDGRKALAAGSELRLKSGGSAVTYTVRSEIGRGGTCIVYDATYPDSLKNRKLVRVKECFPYGLRLKRGADGSLSASGRDAAEFVQAQRRLREAYQRNHELFITAGLTNTVPNTSDFCAANGTVYIVFTYLDGETLADHACSSLREALQLLRGAARVLERLHAAGYLYLDLKPQNILTVRGSTDLVQLFDFDAMLSEAELRGAAQDVRTACSVGWAPPEQQAGRVRQLSPASDVFSLGAVLFSLLYSRTPTAFDCAPDTVYGLAASSFGGRPYRDALAFGLTAFLRRCLASYPGDRYQRMSEAREALDRLIDLSDETKVCLYSTPLSRPAFFAGREAELAELGRLLGDEHHRVISLCGVGGIGKSSLMREYIARRREGYDAVLWLEYQPDGLRLLADDRQILISGTSRMREETTGEYARRKAEQLRLVTAEQRVLCVVDNVEPEGLMGLQPLMEAGWQLVLISRSPLPQGFCPELRLAELGEEEQAEVFVRYAALPLQSDQDRRDFRAIAGCVSGHTLTVELIARQISRSHLTLSAAAELIRKAGLAELSGEAVDYIRDQRVTRAPFHRLLDQLIALDRFGREERRLMRLLTLFGAGGVRAEDFRELALAEEEGIRALAASGWLKTEDGWLRLHPLIREYVQTWPWKRAAREAEALMQRLYGRMVPPDQPEDTGRIFPADYQRLAADLRLAEEVSANVPENTPMAQLLRYRVCLDAPLDEDREALTGMVELLENPQGLPPRCVLRLLEQSAFRLQQRQDFETALDQLERLRACLRLTPDRYYLAVYLLARATILSNWRGEEAWEECLRLENMAIAALREADHPLSPRLLGFALVNKVITLINLNRPRGCEDLLAEAGTLVETGTGLLDEERYQYLCVSAMFEAMNGQKQKALAFLERADAIVQASPDSAMALIDHLLDQTAPIRVTLGDWDEALAAVRQAIHACQTRIQAAPYRRKLEDAEGFLEYLQKLRE